jgi:uncharacterized protein (TIGR02246 family)
MGAFDITESNCGAIHIASACRMPGSGLARVSSGCSAARRNAILKFAARTADIQTIRWIAGDCRVRGPLSVLTQLPLLTLRGLTLTALTLLGALDPALASAKEQCVQADVKTAAAWFDQWNLALASLNPDRVAQHYWQDAVLLPTLSNTPRTTPAMVREYFVHFLEQHPRGRIDTRTLHMGCNVAIDMGTYTFALLDGDGHGSEVAGRYTFVYEYRGGAWKILHHHSSVMPELAVNNNGPAPGTKAKGTGKSGAGRGASGSASKVSIIGGSQPFLNADNSPNVAQFYPAEARERGEHGAVSMQVCTGVGGELNSAPEILESSGSPQLDAAAQEWATAADWIPATRQSGVVEGCTRVRVEFNLG